MPAHSLNIQPAAALQNATRIQLVEEDESQIHRILWALPRIESTPLFAQGWSD